MNEEENNHEFPPGEHGDEGGEELRSARPAVAAAQGKMVIIVGLAIFCAVIIIKFLFFNTKEIKPPVRTVKDTVAQAPRTGPENSGFTSNEPLPVTVPPPTTQTAPTPVLPPPPPVEQVAPPPPPGPPSISSTQAPTDEQLRARMRSPMVSGNGKVNNSANATKKKAAAAGNDPNSTFAQSVADSESETVEATQVKNLNRTLIQGKIIEGVLETAIDSTLPGSVRAIVSHDTYAESGRAILIPKGSRIVGVYNSNIRRGQARVFIIWQRVIRPDGVDVAINSPGIDALGRGGMTGDVDNKYFEAFSTAILTSSLDVGVAAIGDALFGNQQQTETTANGGTTSTSSPTATAMQNAVQSIGSVGQSIVNSTVNLQPTIHVDQGERISIFVNKDVVFPSGMGDASFIP